MGPHRPTARARHRPAVRFARRDSRACVAPREGGRRHAAPCAGLQTDCGERAGWLADWCRVVPRWLEATPPTCDVWATSGRRLGSSSSRCKEAVYYYRLPIAAARRCAAAEAP